MSGEGLQRPTAWRWGGWKWLRLSPASGGTHPYWTSCGPIRFTTDGKPPMDEPSKAHRALNALRERFDPEGHAVEWDAVYDEVERLLNALDEAQAVPQSDEPGEGDRG